ncbi:MAG: hypothetical protein ACREUK_13265 [Burkholderiales bacterium]
MGNQLRVLGRLIQRSVCPQFSLDFVIRRQGLVFLRADLACGFAFGKREVVDAVLSHDARRGGSDSRARSVLPRSLAAHCGASID